MVIVDKSDVMVLHSCHGKSGVMVTVLSWLQCCHGYSVIMVIVLSWLQCCYGNSLVLVKVVSWLVSWYYSGVMVKVMVITMVPVPVITLRLSTHLAVYTNVGCDICLSCFPSLQIRAVQSGRDNTG